MIDKCCDKCIYYEWYYDHCKKWNCNVDDRYCCNFFKDRKVEKYEKKS